MDWTVQPFSRKSAATGASFEAGERVVSFVYKDERGDLQRLDLRESELEANTLPQNVLGRWTHAVKAKEERQKAKQDTLLSAEACFLSLFQKDTLEDTSESALLQKDQVLLQQLLALMLERKRILRHKGPQALDGSLVYIHVASQKTYTIPALAYSKEDLERVTTSLKRILAVA